MRRILLLSALLLAWASVAHGQSSFPGTLPLSCANNQIAVYQSATRVWICGNNSGSGDVTASGTLTSNAVVLGGGTTVVKAVAGIFTDGTSKLTLGQAGTSVGALALSNATSGTITFSPVTGALGTIAIAVPAVAGNLATTTGTLTSGDCVEFDSSGRLVAAGAACGAGGGDVTASGTLTASALMLGGGTTVISALGSLGTTTTVLHGNAAGAPTFAQVVNADISTSAAIALSKLATQAATTVVANNTGGAAVPTAVTFDDLATAMGILDIPSLATGDILYASAANTLSALTIGTDDFCLKATATIPAWEACGGGGDFSGPGSSTDNAIVRFDGTGGKTGQNSAVTIADTTGVIAGTQGVTFSNATSGTVALATVAGALGTVTASLPARTGTVALETGSTFTTGTIQLRPIYLFTAGVCQNTTASIGLSLFTSDTPTAACKTGSNTTFGVAQYTATAQQAQGMILVPADLTSTSVLLKAAYMGETTSSGNVTWTFSYARVAAGSTLDPSWTDITVTDAAGTANQLNIIEQTLTLTSLAANDLLFWKFTYTTAPTTPGNQDLIMLSLIPLRTFTIGG